MQQGICPPAIHTDNSSLITVIGGNDNLKGIATPYLIHAEAGNPAVSTCNDLHFILICGKISHHRLVFCDIEKSVSRTTAHIHPIDKYRIHRIALIGKDAQRNTIPTQHRRGCSNRPKRRYRFIHRHLIPLAVEIHLHCMVSNDIRKIARIGSRDRNAIHGHGIKQIAIKSDGQRRITTACNGDGFMPQHIRPLKKCHIDMSFSITFVKHFNKLVFKHISHRKASRIRQPRIHIVTICQMCGNIHAIQ